MAKVLLVFPDVKCGYGTPKYPPLGLAYLAAVLEKQGVDVECLDLRGIKGADGVFKEEVSRASHVGFYASVLNQKKVLELIHEVRNMKNAVVFVGGPQASVEPEFFGSADYVIVGEGENSIGKVITGLPGTGLFHTPTVDLDSIPFPAWHFFGKEHEMLPVMTTRGCSFECCFCSTYKVFGRTYRKRSVENVMDELRQNVYLYGMKHFEIIDDNFTLDKQFVKDFCSALIMEDLGLSWDCVQGVRIDTLDYVALDLMYCSGCRMIGVGVESGDQLVVDAIGKKMELKKVEENIMLAKRAGLRVKAFFVIGAPGDNFEKTKMSIAFFKRCRIDVPRFGMLVPYKGTKLREWIKKNATVLVGDDEFTHGLEYGEIVVPFETADFVKEKRLKAYELATDEAEIWTVRMRFGKIAGLLARPRFIRKVLKRVYYNSNFLKKVVWD